MRGRGISLFIPGFLFFLTIILFIVMLTGFYLDSDILRKIWVIIMTITPIIGFITAIKARRGKYKPWLIIGHIALIFTVSVLGVLAIVG
ncbi:hypothetical protein [Metabacillus iocasae]|uniref:Uncharacterized protein n=1 Tax=Priestia iocasae TaxID=2291674 RepID=A0ABS2QVZ4_9BACI|nr:hypothetical protein [Metabacillus iocasae]MBM7703448.1 hypothetical protein [Metabacillus iocasae]